jgi:hypothetical protein
LIILSVWIIPASIHKAFFPSHESKLRFNGMFLAAKPLNPLPHISPSVPHIIHNTTVMTLDSCNDCPTCAFTVVLITSTYSSNEPARNPEEAAVIWLEAPLVERDAQLMRS